MTGDIRTGHAHADTAGGPTAHSWTTHAAAETLVRTLVGTCTSPSPRLRDFAARLSSDTWTRLFDWVDHVTSDVSPGELRDVGYVDGWRTAPGVWRHPGAQLPAIVPSARSGVALRVDDVTAFALANGAASGVAGSPGGALRTLSAWADSGVTVAVVERRSWRTGVDPEETGADDQARACLAGEAWRLRDRHLTGARGMTAAEDAAGFMVDLVGADLAADAALRVERQYWQRRNRAATLQHMRQDRLGLGWGNNDHHTFRSSRPEFVGLMRVFSTLGFVTREQFHAGAEAGWGAQVLEHPGTGAVLFADVDLGPDELGVDFAQHPLTPADRLGTVGLWCALHGESILAAGMHHLEGQFDFDRLRADLEGFGVSHMKPFSDFPHLRQAFTQAERWVVPAPRLASLVQQGHLTAAQADALAQNGAPGSHLENLTRGGGFKGFNQSSVSTTLRATDARAYGAQAR